MENWKSLLVKNLHGKETNFCIEIKHRAKQVDSDYKSIKIEKFNNSVT